MKQNILSSILSLTALAITVLNPVNAIAQTIGGDVYGGGKQGAVNTGNTKATSTTLQTAVTLTSTTTNSTSVTISDGATVRTVFGGGENGRCYGQTNVTVEGGEIGAEKWTGSIHGGVFGAGDGSTAWVFGKENTITIKGGTIYNNVYGGGNQADLMGCANVILQNGTYYGSVFGGARMANIYGHTFVKLDGQNGPAAGETPMIIPSVYGGNDISGTISTSSSNAWSWTQSDNIDISNIPIILRGDDETKALIDNTWNCFVCSTYPLAEGGTTALTTNNNMFVGNLYAGGNGDYTYNYGNEVTLIDTPADAANNIEETTKSFGDLTKPEVAKTYLNLQGGTFGYVYGGGNNATVTENADIMVWNAHFDDSNNGKSIVASIPESRVDDMGVMKSMFTISGGNATPTYQIDRIFGGNNKAAMAIQPRWFLAKGTFNNIYSGGNKGDMTNPNGILLSIGSRGIYANNVYGGCRMADVSPMNGDIAVTEIPELEMKSMKGLYDESGNFQKITYSSYSFAENYSARVYITEGHINNVYGGNDISGEVYLGTNVAVNGAFCGNIYGGGNGSYAYTDNSELANDPDYGDYYYSPATIDALNAKRPHVENTLLHIWGKENQKPVINEEDGSLTATNAAEKPVVITGGVFCGGNSATLKSSNGKDATANLTIGKNVVINAVYLGSNGENMVTQDILKTYAGSVDGKDYSQLDLTNEETFAKYMEGCAVDILPTVTYDWTEGNDPHTFIGSFYNGGNVGSLKYSEPITLNMPSNLVIYNSVVGGCNNADVAVSSYNAAYEGGVSVANADASKPKITINMDSYLEPRELTPSMTDDGFVASAKLDWDKRKYYQLGDDNAENMVFKDLEGNDVAVQPILYGANVFGGCYTSGHINGDVTINIDKDLISPAVLANNDAQSFLNMGTYAFAKTMTVYGGGYGKQTSIWGNTHVNLSDAARIISVMGGGDLGTIGHGETVGSTFVNCESGLTDYSKVTGSPLPYNAVQVYGGAFAGTINGNAELQLKGGTYRNVFGGSCDADIDGYTSLYIGNLLGERDGYPYISGNAYGGNDFGGLIKGYKDYSDDYSGYNSQTVRTARYLEYNGGRVNNIYGGSYGSYDYKHNFVEATTDGTTTTNDYNVGDTEFHFPLAQEVITTDDGIPTNTYVNIRCTSIDKTNDLIQQSIFGGGQGIMTQTGIVDAKQTYVYLHGANWQSRNNNLSNDVYGGGYYSIVENTKVDALRACTSIIYGGSYGTSAKNLNTDALKNITYNSTSTEVNIYDGMDNSNMSVFGGGGYTGSANTNVNLYGGLAHNVYGGSYNEGYCGTTNVNVPDATNTVTGAASTASVNAIFGGGYGNDVTLPCDENETNVTFSSSTAYVADVIYGGNNAKRAAKTTNVTINVPVKTGSGESATYVSVCGAGNGAGTIAGFTNVTINSGAQVNNVYGGGRDGKVFGFYKNISEDARTYYDETYNIDPSKSTKRHDYAAWEWKSTDDGKNTNITINQGATVQNVYGGGYGSDATVTGSTSVYNMGGTVVKDIYGGGFAGNVLYQQKSEKASDETVLVEVDNTTYNTYNNYQKNNISTYISHHGGTVVNIYGGGRDGNVGSDHENSTANTYVNIGEEDKSDFYDGSPIVLQSVYGGGYRGAVLGKANINMYNGYIGYNYDAENGYTENIKKSADDTNNSLKESGNIFGGGYGEGATTDHTIVNMYDGTIRNSLYGGGEIASVGVADVNSINQTDRTHIPNITVAGSTQVNMYGGLVSSNVFGGGRGYAIDSYGRTTTGEIGYSDGYTFGKTNVNIYRGTIGTDATLVEGNGNVFGGGNIGYIYAADVNITDNYKNVGKSDADGYYHTSYGDGLMTEDSKVVITPVCKALEAGTVNGKTYQKGEIIPHEDLDKITSNDDWNSTVLGDLDKQGVTIRNAVFAGGNVSSGSDKVYANTVTIYGNATASVIDCLSKDLVTIGADDIGGLYGDGNLTFVDGYRELNITNYGTDYYNLNSELTSEEYQKLNERERAYFEMQYICNESYTSTNTTYTKDQKITDSEYKTLSDDEKSYWRLIGVCTLYAGRMLNTIQRADFCGVFGSRMVLSGAQDRVPETPDYTKYTINRVGELSLNQIANNNGGKNGNYFGIYNTVNYLGALTSDVTFDDTRMAEGSSYAADGSSYKEWKQKYINHRNRNNGTSKNEVALASGVWLELVNKKAADSHDQDVYSTYDYNAGDKIYGPVTGVVELELINAATGEGGGYVYALNVHGAQSASGAKQTTLTAANEGAVSYKQFTYNRKTTSDDNMETSGNFINSKKQIIDECYPTKDAWMSSSKTSYSKAHYWFIRGNYYIYDQNISAYTGAAQAYAEAVEIPLTITAQAHGKLKLLNVQDNFYANWTAEQYAALDSKYKLDGDESVIVIDGNSYSQNSPISYWDYMHLPESVRAMFTKDTYVCTTAVGDYTKGQVLTKTRYDALSADVKDNFNVTNALNSDNGFLLTYDWSNPKVWSNYYIKQGSQSKDDMIIEETKKSDSQYSDYMLSPTYKFTGDAMILGQKQYSLGQVISKTIHDSEPSGASTYTSDAQATFDVAYVATGTCKATWGGQDHYYVKGGAISATNYAELSAEDKAKFDVGYTCINTYKVSDEKYYISGDIITKTEYDAMSGDEVKAAFSPAYVCTTAGAWGGKLFEAGKNYEALDYSALSATDRANFSYNLDAFDILQANSIEYDVDDITKYTNSSAYTNLGNYGDRHTDLYAKEQSIDYTATYNGADALTIANSVTVNNASTNVINMGDVISREDFENNLINEKSKYVLIAVQKEDDTYLDTENNCYYFVKEDFWLGEDCYSVGTQVSPTTYKTLTTDNKGKINIVNASSLRPDDFGEESYINYYYCNSEYTATTALTPKVGSSSSIAAGSKVDAGTIITVDNFKAMKNEQHDFTINGSVPVETSTLYVAPSADINSLSQDKIMTVVYEYSYIESTEDDKNNVSYERISECHIVNIRVHFESGIPDIGELLKPATVLPGNAVSLNQPSVTKGAYEILGGGWEIYTNENDAKNHKNGQEYTNNNTKMYWYQNGYQVAYYAKTYLGKTYSNSVPVTIANYHRMADVMAKDGDSDGLNGADYMYLNEAGKNSGIRNPKVYVKDASELDQMATFFGLTKGGSTGFESIANCANIDFIIDGDIDHTATWASLGDATDCFSGNIHGDGHTISGLDHSLLGSLCGNVYNLGVTGSYTGSGITDAGDGNAYNCWVATTGSVTNATKPVFGGDNGNTYNCYYYNGYGTRTGATKSDLSAFVDGEVAYNLNSYYLAKRNGESEANYRYVTTTRYGNEDFIYADGVIPQTANIRKTDTGYDPIYPDDYIFFGQKLTYGIIPGTSTDSHVDHPQAVNRITNADDESLNTKKIDTDPKTANRVYRASAYYKSKTMGCAYFNMPTAFKDSYTMASGNIYNVNTAVTLPYKNMTAIDFTGYNDATTKTLDYDKLTAFATSGLTRNLLVYADPKNDATSYSVLEDKLPEATLKMNAAGKGYNEVAVATDAAQVKGHLVDLTKNGKSSDGDKGTASRNHYLVDKEFFNCPISYTFDDDSKMWYQRKPDNYVNSSSDGWEAISLPFTADIVSTQTKGEITHFYTGSETGHEYWLRSFDSVGSTDANGKTTEGEVYANFSSLAAGTESKTVANTFLWDYYYNNSSELEYYKSERSYSDYPLYEAAVPYIIGFPGNRFYEFDMSGNFEPAGYSGIDKIAAQTVSFISEDNATIAVSDDELSASTADGYSYMPNYSNETIAVGSYVANSTGSGFDKTTAEQAAVPFRPYFKAVSSSPAKRICFSSSLENMEQKGEELSSEIEGKLIAYSKRGAIVVESTLKDPQQVTITNVAGITVSSFTINEGETIPTFINYGGVYIVNSSYSGLRGRKLSVR